VNELLDVVTRVYEYQAGQSMTRRNNEVREWSFLDGKGALRHGSFKGYRRRDIKGMGGSRRLCRSELCLQQRGRRPGNCLRLLESLDN
jgi:hypothetical protein